jgi:hypothetical protein
VCLLAARRSPHGGGGGGQNHKPGRRRCCLPLSFPGDLPPLSSPPFWVGCGRQWRLLLLLLLRCCESQGWVRRGPGFYRHLTGSGKVF